MAHRPVTPGKIMTQASNCTPDQGILSARPQTYWKRSLAAVGLLLALGYGGLANAATCAGQTTTITGTANDETLWVQQARM